MYGRLGVWWPPAGEHFGGTRVLSPLQRLCPCRLPGELIAAGMSCPPRWREHCFIRSPMVLPLAAALFRCWRGGELMRLFVGDDWAEDHHDVEVMDEAGKVLARRRLPAGIAGMAQLHALAGGLLGEEAGGSEVLVGIETDHGPWVIGAGRGGLPGVPGEPAAVGPVPPAAPGVGGQERRRRRARAGRHGPHRLPPAARGGRRLAGGGGRQGPGPHPQDDDLGADPGDPAAAPPAAGVLPRRPGGLRRPRRPRHPGAAGQGTGPAPGPEADPRAAVRRDETGRAAQRHRAGHRGPDGAAQRASSPSPRRSPSPTPPPSGPSSP